MTSLFKDFAESRGGAHGVVSQATSIRLGRAYENGKAILSIAFEDTGGAQEVLCNQLEVFEMQDLVRREKLGNPAMLNELDLAADSIIEQIKYPAPQPKM